METHQASVCEESVFNKKNMPTEYNKTGRTFYAILNTTSTRESAVIGTARIQPKTIHICRYSTRADTLELLVVPPCHTGDPPRRRKIEADFIDNRGAKTSRDMSSKAKGALSSVYGPIVPHQSLGINSSYTINN